MRRKVALLILICACLGVAFTLLARHSPAQNANSRVTTNSRKTDNVSNETQTSRKSKMLVKQLPEGVEGVEIKAGALKLRPGFKFVKNENGSVTVARMNNGNGVGGSWECKCDDKEGGDCEAVISGGSISCKVVPFSCNSCSMTVVVNKVRTSIMRF